MAANSYTTTQLLTAIKRSGHIPSNQTPFSDTDLLNIADEEIQTGLMSQFLSVRENYYLTYYDQTVNATGIYPIHSRSTGSGISDLQLVVNTTVYQIVRMDIGGQFATNTSSSGNYSSYFQGNNIVVTPNPVTGTIRQYYSQRPNTLVATSSCAQITAINFISNTLTFSSLPTTITTSSPCDLIKDQPHFECLAIDQTPTAVVGTTVTFASLPSNLSVGDWVALAGQSCIPQIPVEFRALLAMRVAERVSLSQGYTQKAQMLGQKRVDMEKALISIINPRVTEQTKTVNPDQGFLGNTFRRQRNWRAT